MNKLDPRAATLRRVGLLTLLGAVAHPAAVRADDSHAADLLRCRALAASAERLACYDAIRVGGSSPPPSGSARSEAAPTPAAVEAERAFGAEQRRAAAQVNEIRSSIPGLFTGWEPKTRWTLANGQVWAVADQSRAYYRLDSPSVRITRGVFGSFFMEVAGVSHAVAVRRVE